VNQAFSAQLSSSILMVEPVVSGSNPDTAQDNKFQAAGVESNGHAAVLQEFREFVSKLRACGVEVAIFQDDLSSPSCDCLFPNNWFSTHAPSQLVLYPMMSKLRRLERRDQIVQFLEKRYSKILDLTSFEIENRALEGTGSLVLDRALRIAFACRSKRTDQIVLEKWASELEYEVVLFDAVDRLGAQIYHTNVMMSIGHGFALVCIESISDKTQQKKLIQKIENSGRQLISISLTQLHSFAGNLINLESKDGESLVVMSESAYRSLEPIQVQSLAKFGKIVTTNLTQIEKFGGGSARCMIAELF